MKKIIRITLFATLLLSPLVWAKKDKDKDNPSTVAQGLSFATNDCSTDNVTLTAITAVTGSPSGQLLSSSYDANQCVTVTGTNNDSHYDPDEGNFGELNDGLLNGDGDFPIYEFIGTDDLLDANAFDLDTTIDDPGWIKLVKYEYGVGYDYASVTTDAGSINIGDLVTLDVTGDGKNSLGTWRLSVDGLNVISQVQDILGRAATFDQLAIVLKGGSSEFVVYDFNFDEIFAAETANGNDVFNFLTPYEFSGSFSMADVTNNGGQIAGLSHMTIWARDPVSPPTLVNAPASLGAMLLGLGMLARRRIKPTKSS